MAEEETMDTDSKYRRILSRITNEMQSLRDTYDELVRRRNQAFFEHNQHKAAGDEAVADAAWSRLMSIENELCDVRDKINDVKERIGA